MERVLLQVCHLPDDHIAFVRRHGLVPVQLASWKKAHLKKEALKQLILLGNEKQQSHASVRSVSPVFTPPLNVGVDRALFDYFGSFFTWALRAAVSEKRRRERSTVIIVVNLMAFHFPSSVADKIVRGLRTALEANDQRFPEPLHIVYLTRNVKSFQDSLYYQETVALDRYPVKFDLIDYKGIKVENNSPTFAPIPRAQFRAVLTLTNKEFYRKLIYETNSYLGHFVLNNSHVRTHYDLRDFLRKDDVFEEVFARISAVTASFSNVLAVYVGLESAALRNLANQLIRYSNNVFQAMDVESAATSTELHMADCVLLLTDIVNSGKTVEDSVALITSKKAPEVPITCYSMIRMENSPESINGCQYEAAVTIRRSYYPTDLGECRLCKLGQPQITVKRCEDFYVVRDEQLTPLDFWELVHDCGALRRREDEKMGRVLAYRVESKNLIDRYNRWLKNVIVSKYNSVLYGRKPSLVLTVEEEGGQAFAGLVCDALSLSRETIRSISRLDLEKDLFQVNEQEHEPEFRGERVLLVDDGINDGDTMRRLAAYCTKRATDPLGAVVLDSRLGDIQNARLRVALGRAPLISLYRWAGRLVRYPSQTKPPK